MATISDSTAQTVDHAPDDVPVSIVGDYLDRDRTTDDLVQRLTVHWSRPGTRLGAWFLSLVLAAAGTWWVVQPHGDGSGGPAASVAPDEGAATLRGGAAPAAPEAGGATLVDRKAGYQLTYPDSWAELSGAGTQGHVIGIDGGSAFSIRTFPLQHPVDTADVKDMRAVTDAILSTPDARLTVLDVREVEVAGLPAVYYLYYFPDGGRRGIHAHYFVFDGTRMHTLVFQVVPAARFGDYAAQFDDVVASFQPLA